MSDIPIPSLDKLVETFRKAEAEWAGHRPPVSRETHILAAVLPLVLRGPLSALSDWLSAEDEWNGELEDDRRCREAREAARSVRDQIAALIGG